VQRLGRQGAAISLVPVAGSNPQVLFTAAAGPLSNSLHRSATTVAASHQPSGFRQKAVSFADLAHQIEAAWPIRQARKNRGVDLFVKTVKFDFGVMLDQRFVPGHPEISIRKPRRGGRIIKTDFHPETFEIGETHGIYSSFFTGKQRYAFDEY